MTYANIKGAWRTRKQALTHILTELVAGRLGAVGTPKNEPWNEGCAYEAVKDGKVTHCGVGSLFNPAQIRSLKSRGLNMHGLEFVEDAIGARNLETVTGLCMDELYEIQELHDAEWDVIQASPAKSRLHQYLRTELKKA